MFKILILSFLISGQASHTTFLGVECIPGEGVIIASLKLDFNDLVFDYRKTVNDDQSFDPSGEIDTTIILLSKYISQRILISSDNKSLKGKLTNIESANGELKITISYFYDKKAKQFSVKNFILTDVYVNQSNLLIFKYKDFEEGVELSPVKTEYKINVK